jgi:hypothetical protein
MHISTRIMKSIGRLPLGKRHLERLGRRRTGEVARIMHLASRVPWRLVSCDCSLYFYMVSMFPEVVCFLGGESRCAVSVVSLEMMDHHG